MHNVLSTVTIEDSAVFTNFVRNTLGVTTQITIYLIKNFVESFGELIAMNNVDINTFSRIIII